MSYTRTATYANRRQQSWGRNQNTARFVSPVKLGPVMHTILVALMVLVLGVIYLSQASGSATYDHTAYDLDQKISELSTKKADLEVENARLSSLESVKNSDVAKAMTQPSTEYVR
jgi:cell division protein FtsL